MGRKEKPDRKKGKHRSRRSGKKAEKQPAAPPPEEQPVAPPPQQPRPPEVAGRQVHPAKGRPGSDRKRQGRGATRPGPPDGSAAPAPPNVSDGGRPPGAEQAGQGTPKGRPAAGRHQDSYPAQKKPFQAGKAQPRPPAAAPKAGAGAKGRTPPQGPVAADEAARAEAVTPGPGEPAGVQPPPPYQAPPGYYPPGQYWPVPVWPPQAYGPPVYGQGYPQGYPAQPGAYPPPTGYPAGGEQTSTGEPSAPPPGTMIVPPYPYPPPGYPQQFPPEMMFGQPPAVPPLEDEEFEELTFAERSHWRVDLKWMFGILLAVVVFLTLLSAGLYRVTGPGAARNTLVPLIERTTEVKSLVKQNYEDMRKQARRSRNAQIVVPDIDIDISLDAADVNSMDADDLADEVISLIAESTYENGYRGDLPMETAKGVGEERARAVCSTLIATLNRDNHETLLIIVIVLGCVSAALAVPFLVFCRGWGKMIGAGIVLICASLPASAYIRTANQFIWSPTSSGVYKGAMHQAFSSLGSLSVVFFDVALGLGALLLLVGVVLNIIARRRIGRTVPFDELEAPEPLLPGTVFEEEEPLLPPEVQAEIDREKEEEKTTGDASFGETEEVGPAASVNGSGAPESPREPPPKTTPEAFNE